MQQIQDIGTLFGFDERNESMGKDFEASICYRWDCVVLNKTEISVGRCMKLQGVAAIAWSRGLKK